MQLLFLSICSGQEEIQSLKDGSFLTVSGTKPSAPALVKPSRGRILSKMGMARRSALTAK